MLNSRYNSTSNTTNFETPEGTLTIEGRLIDSVIKEKDFIYYANMATLNCDAVYTIPCDISSIPYTITLNNLFHYLERNSLYNFNMRHNGKGLVVLWDETLLIVEKISEVPESFIINFMGGFQLTLPKVYQTAKGTNISWISVSETEVLHARKLLQKTKGGHTSKFVSTDSDYDFVAAVLEVCDSNITNFRYCVLDDHTLITNGDSTTVLSSNRNIEYQIPQTPMYVITISSGGQYIFYEDGTLLPIAHDGTAELLYRISNSVTFMYIAGMLWVRTVNSRSAAYMPFTDIRVQDSKVTLALQHTSFEKDITLEI